MSAETIEIEAEVVDTIGKAKADENTNHGTENEYKDYFKESENSNERTEKKKGKVDSDTIPAKQWVNAIDFIGMKSLPFLSQKFGTGNITEKNAALGTVEKKMLEPAISDFLESLGYIKMNPGIALIITILGIYGSILIPDILMGMAMKKQMKDNPFQFNGFNSNTGFHEQQKEAPKTDNNRGRSTTRARQTDGVKKSPGRPKGSTKKKYEYTEAEIIEKLKEKK